MDGEEEEAGGGSSVKAAEKGDYVIVEYEGEIYPGKVMDRASNGVLVNVMSKYEGQRWKWPKP